MAKDIEIKKKGHSKDQYQDEKILELAKCMVDPIHFIETYIMIQHPLEGRIPFRPYPFQLDMIRAFHEHRNVISLTSRQMGKCVVYTTLINKNTTPIRIGKLVKLSFKEKLVTYFEGLLLKYATSF